MSESVFHVHLVSDATGETLNAVANACISQFSDVEVIEYPWSLVRTKGQLEMVIREIAAQPGLVLFTLVDQKLHDLLVEGCGHLKVPCVPVLDAVITSLADFFGAESQSQPGRQHLLDSNYFKRIEALSFTMAHDDGQMVETLNEADIVLVGVSRTSKTPTCIYLANRGIKTANIPLVPNTPVTEFLENITDTLVIGLTTSPSRLVQIRRNRLLTLHESRETEYIDQQHVRQEVLEARKLFERKGWPVIDVTRRSIEETAAEILNLYHASQSPPDEKSADE